MAERQIRFEDGAAYERMMGIWSRLAGDIFLDWIAPPNGQRWLDIGCGNGAFTETIVDRCAPAEVQGVDPSEGQLGFARARLAGKAEFRTGQAMALPFAADSFDVAVMALVIFFVPDPAKGVAEMARVVRSGGLVAAYAWDIPGGGFPLEPIWAEMRAMNVAFPTPPSAAASSIAALRQLWTAAGLTEVETLGIPVRRTFASFDEFWDIAVSSSIGGTVAAMSADQAGELKSRVSARLAVKGPGPVTFGAHANAVKGHVA